MAKTKLTKPRDKMYFKFRNKEYCVEKDAYQYVLKGKIGDVYYIDGYYSDIYFLIKKLISLHVVKDEDGKHMIKTIDDTCKELKEEIRKALK